MKCQKCKVTEVEGSHCAYCELKRISDQRAEALERARERADKAEAEADSMQSQFERLRHERAIALNVKTKEGVTCSEWLLRTGLAEERAEKAEAELALIGHIFGPAQPDSFDGCTISRANQIREIKAELAKRERALEESEIYWQTLRSASWHINNPEKFAGEKAPVYAEWLKNRGGKS